MNLEKYDQLNDDDDSGKLISRKLRYLVASLPENDNNKPFANRFPSLFFPNNGWNYIIPVKGLKAAFRSLWMFFFLGRWTKHTRVSFGATSETKIKKRKWINQTYTNFTFFNNTFYRSPSILPPLCTFKVKVSTLCMLKYTVHVEQLNDFHQENIKTKTNIFSYINLIFNFIPGFVKFA